MGEEAAAIAAVFAEAKATLHVSGVKIDDRPLLLGGAGAAGLRWRRPLAVHHGVIPPTINLENLDPLCGALGLNFTPKRRGDQARRLRRWRTASALAARMPSLVVGAD